MTKEEFCLLLVNYNSISCVSCSSSNTTDFLKEVARDIMRGWIQCRQCGGTGKSYWDGHWCWTGFQSEWVEQEHKTDKCSKCKGKGRLSYRLKDVKRFGKYERKVK